MSTPQKPEFSHHPGNPLRLWIVSLLIVLSVALLIAWQVFSLQHPNTDPTIAGHPLSNTETHLHTIAQAQQGESLYLGTHYGVFKSKDNGRTWPQTRGMLNTMMIAGIAISPQSASSIAVVALPSTSKGSTAGIYFSANEGTDWQLRRPATLPSSAYPFSIYAGSLTAGHFYAFYLYAGWYETLDLGEHWHAITPDTFSPMQNPRLLTFPDDPQHLLLGGDIGLFESRDNGAQWTRLSSVQGIVQALLILQKKPTTLLCATDQGLYRWEDGQTQPTLLPTPQQKTFARLTSDKDGQHIYGLAGRDLWYSSDRGTHWRQQYHFQRGDMIALLVDATDPSRLYTGFFQPAQVFMGTGFGGNWSILTS